MRITIKEIIIKLPVTFGRYIHTYTYEKLRKECEWQVLASFYISTYVYTYVHMYTVVHKKIGVTSFTKGIFQFLIKKHVLSLNTFTEDIHINISTVHMFQLNVKKI